MTLDWKDLADRAIDYRNGADIFYDNGQPQSSLEQAHLSVELIMKAAILKGGGAVPKIHDLRKIAEIKVRGRKSLLQAIMANRYLKNDFADVVSAWEMQFRYKRLLLDPMDVGQLLDSYRKVYTWIRTSFVD
jgi:HEPN domain-containing protein